MSEQKKRLARFMRWCPPQAPLRADPLLSCGARNRQRTAAGQRAGSAPEQGMWLAGATSFRRALEPWGPGGRARRRRRRARRRRRSARSAALSGHLRSRNGLRSGCTPGMEGASKALKSLFFDGVTGRSPGAKNARLSPLPAIRRPVESCGQTSGGGSRIGPLGRGGTPTSIPPGAIARPAVRHTSLIAPDPPAQARTHHRGTRGPTEAHRARSRADRPPPDHPEAPFHLPCCPCRPQVPNGPHCHSPALSIAIPVLLPPYRHIDSSC